MEKGFKLVIIVFFVAIFGFLLFNIYDTDIERRELKAEISSVADEVDMINEDNERLNSQMEYFSNPRNLEKELRARFNYRLPNEKLIIIVPKHENEE